MPVNAHLDSPRKPLDPVVLFEYKIKKIKFDWDYINNLNNGNIVFFELDPKILFHEADSADKYHNIDLDFTHQNWKIKSKLTGEMNPSLRRVYCVAEWTLYREGGRDVGVPPWEEHTGPGKLVGGSGLRTINNEDCKKLITTKWFKDKLLYDHTECWPVNDMYPKNIIDLLSTDSAASPGYRTVILSAGIVLSLLLGVGLAIGGVATAWSIFWGTSASIVTAAITPKPDAEVRVDLRSDAKKNPLGVYSPNDLPITITTISDLPGKYKIYTEIKITDTGDNCIPFWNPFGLGEDRKKTSPKLSPPKPVTKSEVARIFDSDDTTMLISLLINSEYKFLNLIDQWNEELDAPNQAHVNYNKDMAMSFLDDLAHVASSEIKPDNRNFIKFLKTAKVFVDENQYEKALVEYEKAFMILEEENQNFEIPTFVRDTAGWWAENSVDDASFIGGIQYLIKENIMVIPVTQVSGTGTDKIPSWIKNNAEWWAAGLISDMDFVSGIQYLIGAGIISISTEEGSSLPGSDDEDSKTIQNIDIKIIPRDDSKEVKEEWPATVTVTNNNEFPLTKAKIIFHEGEFGAILFFDVKTESPIPFTINKGAKVTETFNVFCKYKGDDQYGAQLTFEDPQGKLLETGIDDNWFDMKCIVPEEKDDDGDGIPNNEDECPLVAENVNGYQDDDGCPDDIPTSKLHVAVINVVWPVVDGQEKPFFVFEIKNEDNSLVSGVEIVIRQQKLDPPYEAAVKETLTTDENGVALVEIKYDCGRVGTWVENVLGENVEYDRNAGFGDEKYEHDWGFTCN